MEIPLANNCATENWAQAKSCGFLSVRGVIPTGREGGGAPAGASRHTGGSHFKQP